MLTIDKLNPNALALAKLRCLEQSDNNELMHHLEQNSEIVSMFVFYKTKEGAEFWHYVSNYGFLPN
jgi:hypothetical protein